MKKIGQMYRSGIWTARPGKVEEFIKAWQTSVEWLVQNHPDGWRGEALLAGSEYQSFMTSIQELCEEIQPHRMRVVGYSVSR